MEGLTIPGACCDHIRDCQTGVQLFCVIHPRILGLARRIRDGDKNVLANTPNLREREDCCYEEREDATSHACSGAARIEWPVVQVQGINTIYGRPSEGGCQRG